MNENQQSSSEGRKSFTLERKLSEVMEDTHQLLRLPDSLSTPFDGYNLNTELQSNDHRLPLGRQQNSNSWLNEDLTPAYEALELSPLAPMTDISKTETKPKVNENPPKAPEFKPLEQLPPDYEKKEVPKENQGALHNQDGSKEKKGESTQLKTSNKRKHSSEVVKSCNCKKSKCLKLYCECFASGQYCTGCKCNECHNTAEYIKERKTAITRISKKNPLGFIRRLPNNSHNQLVGCNCKKSECQRNYCSCYRTGLGCTKLCKCVQCKNLLDAESSKMPEK
jgi:hypothetical protein